METISTGLNYLRSALEASQAAWSQIPEVGRSLLGAAIGVLFGAWIASRSQTKRTIVSELHALRSAHALAFSVANKALSLKKQHVRPLEEAFKAALAAHAAFTINPRGGLAIQIDLRTLSQVKFPDQSLEKTVLERCFLGSEAVATLVAALDATDDLRTSINYRNALVNEFRKDPPNGHQERVERYLGVQAASERDERFRDNVLALLAQTNDCIFFSMRLGEHIRKSENRLRRRNGWKYWLPGRKLMPVRWTKADGFIPPEDDYRNWISGFVKDQSLIERTTLRIWQLFRTP